ITRAAWPRLTEKSAASAGSMASVARSDAMLAKQHAPSREGMFEALTFKLRMLHQLAPAMLSPQNFSMQLCATRLAKRQRCGCGENRYANDCGDGIGVNATVRTVLPRRRRLLESKHIPGLIMVSISSFSQTAALMGVLARASMLTALVDGRALTAAELARVAGIAPQSASGHLGRLVDAGLIVREIQGRHRYHR